MKIIQVASLSVLAITLALLQPRTAQAQGQSVTTCNQDVSCLWYANTNPNQSSSIYGQSSIATGVAGASSANSGRGVGVGGASTYFAGMEGIGGVYGVLGLTNGTLIPSPSVTSGVTGAAGANVGVYGVSNSSVGVYGQSTSGWGIHGASQSEYGIVGETNSTYYAAIYGGALNGGTAFYGSGDIQVTGTGYKPGGGSWVATSDQRVKKNVRAFDDGLSKVMRIHPVRFQYNGLGGTTESDKEFIGVIAQDVEKVLPSMVSSRRAKLHPRDTAETDVKQVDPSDFTYLLINAVQEQQKTIERQGARIAALEHGSRVISSSMLPAGMEMGAAFLLLPVGVVIGIRNRRSKRS